MIKGNTYVEKKLTKYVIATMDGKYLKKTPAKNEYVFVDDIELATKAMTRKMINMILEYYYNDTEVNIELVVIPVNITYELVNESN